MGVGGGTLVVTCYQFCRLDRLKCIWWMVTGNNLCFKTDICILSRYKIWHWYHITRWMCLCETLNGFSRYILIISFVLKGLVSSPDSELSNSSPLDDSFEQGHSRTSSYNSQQSKGSGSSSSNTSSNQEKSSSVTSLTEQTSDKEGATSSSRDSWRGTAERRRVGNLLLQLANIHSINAQWSNRRK